MAPIEFARSYTAAWCSQDAASVAAHYAIDGSLRINGGIPALGRNAIQESAQSFMTEFPDLVVTLNWLVEGAHPEYHWTLSGTSLAGRTVRISGFELWTLGADGFIAESHGRFDGVDYERQMSGTT